MVYGGRQPYLERERLQFSPRGRVRKFLVITAFDKFGVHNQVLSLVVGRGGRYGRIR